MKRLTAVLALGLAVATPGLLGDPLWWTVPETAIKDGQPADNYAPLNIGQLKHTATQAKKFLEPALPAGPEKTAVEEKLAEFLPDNGIAYTEAEIAENYAPANLGQLKAVAKPFYDWINVAIDPDIPYPWNPLTPVEENFAPANLGQLKAVFSFGNVPIISQAWKDLHFPNPPGEFDPDEDSDGDGLTNWGEYQQKTDPNDYYNGHTPVMVVSSGNNQTAPPNRFAPTALVARILDEDGNPLENAPVKFSVAPGIGKIAESKTADAGDIYESRTNSEGYVSAWLKLPNKSNTATSVMVQAGTVEDEFYATSSDFVAKWPLATEASTFQDMSGSERHGVYSGGMGWNKKRKAFHLDGVSGRGNVTDSGGFEVPEEMTVTGWVWVDPVTEDGRYMRVLSNKSIFSEANGFEIEYNPKFNRLSFGGAGTEQLVVYGVDLKSKWHHIAFTLKKDETLQTQVGTFYVDGVKIVDSSPSSSYPPFSATHRVAVYDAGVSLEVPLNTTGALTLPTPSTRNLTIGQHSPDPSQSVVHAFAGNIRELQIYARALSDTEIYDMGNITTHSDTDGIPDNVEFLYGTNPLKADTDNDGLTDLMEIGEDEYSACTDPTEFDSNNDGVSDYADYLPTTISLTQWYWDNTGWHFAASTDDPDNHTLSVHDGEREVVRNQIDASNYIGTPFEVDSGDGGEDAHFVATHKNILLKRKKFYRFRLFSPYYEDWLPMKKRSASPIGGWPIHTDCYRLNIRKMGADETNDISFPELLNLTHPVFPVTTDPDRQFGPDRGKFIYAFPEDEPPTDLPYENWVATNDIGETVVYCAPDRSPYENDNPQWYAAKLTRYVWTFTVAEDKDSDGDGLSDAQEEDVTHTGVNNIDSDDDGIPDGWEVRNHLNPLNPADAALDRDGDGVCNLFEYQFKGDANGPDNDGDQLTDLWEFQNGLELNVVEPQNREANFRNRLTNREQAFLSAADADGDGLPDVAEPFWGTRVDETDSDGDGMPDLYEVENGLNPNDINDRDTDLDRDDLSNFAEYEMGTLVFHYDTDGDGLGDGWEDLYEYNPKDRLEGIAGWWRMETLASDSSDPKLLDTSGKAIDGLRQGRASLVPNDRVVYPSAIASAVRPINMALALQGGGFGDNAEESNFACATIRPSPLLTAGTQGPEQGLSFLLWVKPLPRPDSGEESARAIASRPGLFSLILTAQHKIKATIWLSDNTSVVLGPVSAPTNGLPLNTWAHIAITCDTLTGDFKLWQGGTVLASTNIGQNKVLATPQTPLLLGEGMRISKEAPQGSPSLPRKIRFRCPDLLEDDVRFYRRPLAVGEMQAIAIPEAPGLDANRSDDPDGLSNLYEFLMDTNPKNPDSDDDGIPDNVEFDRTTWAEGDSDFDGLSDSDEYLIHNTFPNDADSDEDHLSDGFEFNHEPKLDPLEPDTEFDGMDDWWELHYQFDPIHDDSLGDPDQDGVNNVTEFNNKTNPRIHNSFFDSNGNFKDSDDDGVTDYEEVTVYLTNPTTKWTFTGTLTDGQRADSLLIPPTDPINGPSYVNSIGADPGQHYRDGDDLDGDDVSNLDEVLYGGFPATKGYGPILP